VHSFVPEDSPCWGGRQVWVLWGRLGYLWVGVGVGGVFMSGWALAGHQRLCSGLW